jgi:hypothetical protein
MQVTTPLYMSGSEDEESPSTKALMEGDAAEKEGDFIPSEALAPHRLWRRGRGGECRSWSCQLGDVCRWRSWSPGIWGCLEPSLRPSIRAAKTEQWLATGFLQ